MKKRYIYPAIFHPETKGFSVFFPDLKECTADGESLEDSTVFAEEVLSNYIEFLLENGKTIPNASCPNSISVSGNDFVAMVSCEPKITGKTVKKTLSVPEWLNKEAKKRHINFSSLLQEALIKEISKKQD